MGCFLLQKNILLMRLILLGYYAAFFPVKFSQNIAPKTSHQSRRHICGSVCHHGENGAGHRPFFTLAQICASGVTRDGMTSQTYNVFTRVKRPKSHIATKNAIFYRKKDGCCSITNPPPVYLFQCAGHSALAQIKKVSRA